MMGDKPFDFNALSSQLADQLKNMQLTMNDVQKKMEAMNVVGTFTNPWGSFKAYIRNDGKNGLQATALEAALKKQGINLQSKLPGSDVSVGDLIDALETGFLGAVNDAFQKVEETARGIIATVTDKLQEATKLPTDED